VQVRGLIVRGGQAFLIFKAAWRQQDQAALAGDDRPGSDLTGIPRWRVAAVEADQMGGTNSQPLALDTRRLRRLAAVHDAQRRQVRWLARATLGRRSWAALRGRPGAIGQRVAASADGRAFSAVVRRRRIDGNFPSTRIGSQFIMCSGAVGETVGGATNRETRWRRYASGLRLPDVGQIRVSCAGAGSADAAVR